MIASIIRRSVGAREWGERLSRRARRGARRGGGGERVPTDGPSVPVGRAHTLSRRARFGNLSGLVCARARARISRRRTRHGPGSARAGLRASSIAYLPYYNESTTSVRHLVNTTVTLVRRNSLTASVLSQDAPARPRDGPTCDDRETRRPTPVRRRGAGRAG